MFALYLPPNFILSFCEWDISN